MGRGGRSREVPPLAAPLRSRLPGMLRAAVARWCHSQVSRPWRGVGRAVPCRPRPALPGIALRAGRALHVVGGGGAPSPSQAPLSLAGPGTVSYQLVPRVAEHSGYDLHLIDEKTESLNTKGIFLTRKQDQEHFSLRPHIHRGGNWLCQVKALSKGHHS